MPITTAEVVGPVVLLDGTTPAHGKITFTTNGWDREDGAIILSGPKTVDLDEDGNFSTELWVTDLGDRTVSYRAEVRYYAGNRLHRETLGSFVVLEGGPWSLADILALPPVTMTGTDVATLVQEAQAAVAGLESFVAGSSVAGRRVLTGVYNADINWPDRTSTASWWGTHTPEVGTVSSADGLSYLYIGSGTAIADMPGWVPFGMIYPEHFGAAGDGATNDTTAIQAAIAYADAMAQDVYFRGVTYLVDRNGAIDLTNGDLNVCIRVHTTNPVQLIGVRGRTLIKKVQNTSIAHVIQFGRRVGTVIPARGGLDGIKVEGNLATAATDGVPYEGGDCINVSGSGSGVALRHFEARNAWSYGVGWQRAYWKDCVAEHFVIENTGRDGMDWKVDSNALGYGDNIAKHGFIRGHGQRAESIGEGQQAALDLRYGVSAEHIQVVNGAGQAGVRTQHDDDAGTANASLTHRQTLGDIMIVGAAGSLNLGGTVTPSRGLVINTCWPTVDNVTIIGGEIGMRVRSHRGTYSNITATGAVQNNIEVLSYSTDTDAVTENVFSNVQAIGAGGHDVLVDGNTASIGHTFTGLIADKVTLTSYAEGVEIFGGRVTTYADSGTDNRIMTKEYSSPWKFGRSPVQGVVLDGNSTENLVQGQSAAGLGKVLRLANDANGSTVVLEQMAAGQSIELKNTSGVMARVTSTDTRFFRANGAATQGVILGGDSSYNYLKGLSASGSAKSLLIEQGAEGSTFILNQAATGQSISIRYQGAESLGIDGTRVLAAVPVRMPDGSAAAPSISFGTDTGTGLYRYGAGVVGMAFGGVSGFAFGASTLDLLAVSTEARGIQIGQGRTGSGTSYVDLVGDTTYTDYGARLVRAGSANGDTSLLHRGTGTLRLTAQEAAPIVMSTSGAARVTVADTLVTVAVPIKHASYTVATVPAASGLLGSEIFVSNESGGSVLAFSDGVNWRRVTDRAIIS